MLITRETKAGQFRKLVFEEYIVHIYYIISHLVADFYKIDRGERLEQDGEEVHH